MLTAKQHCDTNSGICGSGEEEHTEKRAFKKLELYVFTDPLCPACWGIEPTLKKINMEYGNLITLRYFIVPTSTSAWIHEQNNRSLSDLWDVTSKKTGMCCDGDVWRENPFSNTELPALAVKAAEMQGRQSGIRYLRRLRELLFLNKKNVTEEDVLVDCAKEAGLDEREFNNDFHSGTISRALRCDMSTTEEMGVQEVPSMIFFNDCIEDAGVKVSGLHSYSTYVEVLTDLLGFKPEPNTPCTLMEFLEKYRFVATKEIAEVFDLTTKEAVSEMKKLQLQQKVECVPVKHGEFWRYTNGTED
ncbi:YjbH-like, GTP pyrophosphokinase domain [Geomicrobium sp. JCM 19037]|uniref:DsbA family protein n=1 Tax=unclassified Geomicrobium TaxID=2628951 RepID=UPI00045F3DEC|nr:DsbA family protein [Geomicrobium sp. JCM 19037]GAK05788.1 YjbH-like, GTP pyrophosphokinase domain [Geomicrobium sp. JCM 19037]